ncbi:RNA exonuclease 4 [Osmerus mordax]|uniref:RNA exonuclease 4 n=1 Tax=Osmerus mordax TaxID=8014 RepID=UPI00351031AA
MKSKDKTNKSGSVATAKTQKSTSDQVTKKPVKKKIAWKHGPKEPVSKVKDPNPWVPPKDAQHFSANWKTLLKVLTTDPPSKKGKLQQDSKKNTPQIKPVKDISKQAEVPKKPSKDTRSSKPSLSKAGKELTAPGSSKVNGSGEGPAPSEVRQPKAQKRKRDSAKSAGSSEQAANKKKKIEVAENTSKEPDLWFDDVDPDDVEATVGAEAADIMRRRMGTLKANPQDTEDVLVKYRAFDGMTNVVAMDCEMVGVGPDGKDSIVARVSLVNKHGKCIYDKYVKPTERVTDYRTEFSGIRPNDIKNGENVKTVQREVAEILDGRILVGHAIHNDLKILFLTHPKKRIRDTQKYKPFKTIAKSNRPALRVLCREVLQVKVQQGEHSSVQDAQATMKLYSMVKKEWEKAIKDKKKDVIGKIVRKPKAPNSKSK